MPFERSKELLPPWLMRLKPSGRLTGGEQTQPEYDAEKDQPLAPPPETAAPPPVSVLSTTPASPSAPGSDISSILLKMILEAPFMGGYRVTGQFGQTGGAYPGSGHIGLDLVPEGDDWGIYAPLRGEVIFNGYSEGYGYYVKIRHPDGTVTLYAHMAKPSPLTVGAPVADRQQIGMMGATGDATAAHLHFEVYDPQGNRYDPMKWLGSETELGAVEPPAEPPSGQWSSTDAVNAIRYWSKKLGYSDSFADFALAVAWGEAGWDPYNDIIDSNGVPSRGIFQLNAKGRLPGFIARFGEEGVANPYAQAEYNLPYLHAAFEKYGGDSGWASDPMRTLKYGWKHGQVSIWPSDTQLREALAKIATVDQLQPDRPYPAPSQPESPAIQPDRPYPAPTEPEQPRRDPFGFPEHRFSLWPQWLAQNDLMRETAGTTYPPLPGPESTARNPWQRYPLPPLTEPPDYAS